MDYSLFLRNLANGNIKTVEINNRQFKGSRYIGSNYISYSPIVDTITINKMLYKMTITSKTVVLPHKVTVIRDRTTV